MAREEPSPASVTACSRYWFKEVIPIASVDETIVPSTILTETARPAGALPSGGLVHLALFALRAEGIGGYDGAEPLYTEGRARGEATMRSSCPPDRLYVALSVDRYISACFSIFDTEGWLILRVEAISA